MIGVELNLNRWLCLAVIGALYGASFLLPAATLNGEIRDDAGAEPMTPMTLDGKSCYSWAWAVRTTSWFANPALWVAGCCFALRWWRMAVVAGLAAVGLGLSESVPQFLGFGGTGRGTDFLVGYWMWVGSGGLLALAAAANAGNTGSGEDW
jgi:hypothetical protein